MKKRSVAVSVIVLGALLSSASVAGATMRAGVRPASSVNVRRACEPVRYGARCGALVRTDVRGRYATVLGYGPSCGDAYGSHYNHPGVMITAAAGDEGYGVGFPMDQNTVVGLGGSRLSRTSNARGWSEAVWSGTGSGCTTQPKPSWQTHPGCSHRIANDVAADADPATGVALYDSGYGGWLEVGGTDVATAIVSGAYALAANEATQTYASGLYAANAPLYDMRVGANGTCAPQFLCTGEVGYDGPTGNGTPKGIGAF
jgi:hypothetical protein